MGAIDQTSPLSFRQDGAELHAGVVSNDVARIREALGAFPSDQPGVRIKGQSQLQSPLGEDGAIGSIVAEAMGRMGRPVRAILFDKTPQTNWSLGWHQDRTICVKERLEAEGFGPWTVKAGMLHVAPPFGLLARMVTARIHLDDVPETNGPLLIAPESHLRGRVAVEDIHEVVGQCGIRSCLAQAGDVWLYATPILHASGRSIGAAHRRVVQIDYSADDLPHGLEWLGV